MKNDVKNISKVGLKRPNGMEIEKKKKGKIEFELKGPIKEGKRFTFLKEELNSKA